MIEEKMHEAFENCSLHDGYADDKRLEENRTWFTAGWQAARTVSEASLEIFASRCPMCSYQHGHQIGCENNPIDIALRASAAAPKKEVKK